MEEGTDRDRAAIECRRETHCPALLLTWEEERERSLGSAPARIAGTAAQTL